MKARSAPLRRIANRDLFASVLSTSYRIDYFERSMGLVFEREVVGGIGSFEVAGVAIGSVVCALGRRTNPPTDEKLVLDAPTNVSSPATFVEIAVEALGLNEDPGLVRFREFSSLNWELWREDDNSNRSLIARFAQQHDANAIAKHLEQRGHKQRYWVENAP